MCDSSHVDDKGEGQYEKCRRCSPYAAWTHACYPVASEVLGEVVGCVGNGANRSILRPTCMHTTLQYNTGDALKIVYPLFML